MLFAQANFKEISLQTAVSFLDDSPDKAKATFGAPRK